jgi:hypothetical protein
MRRKEAEYYDSELKIKQLFYYKSLSEKQGRHFLGMEYERLGIGSGVYLSKVFSCSRRRILRGRRELDSSMTTEIQIDYSRQRKIGGGAKKKKNLPLVP